MCVCLCARRIRPGQARPNIHATYTTNITGNELVELPSWSDSLNLTLSPSQSLPLPLPLLAALQYFFMRDNNLHSHTDGQSGTRVQWDRRAATATATDVRQKPERKEWKQLEKIAYSYSKRA